MYLSAVEGLELTTSTTRNRRLLGCRKWLWRGLLDTDISLFKAMEQLRCAGDPEELSQVLALRRHTESKETRSRAVSTVMLTVSVLQARAFRAAD